MWSVVNYEDCNMTLNWSDTFKQHHTYSHISIYLFYNTSFIKTESSWSWLKNWHKPQSRVHKKGIIKTNDKITNTLFRNQEQKPRKILHKNSVSNCRRVHFAADGGGSWSRFCAVLPCCCSTFVHLPVSPTLPSISPMATAGDKCDRGQVSKEDKQWFFSLTKTPPHHTLTKVDIDLLVTEMLLHGLPWYRLYSYPVWLSIYHWSFNSVTDWFILNSILYIVEIWIMFQYASTYCLKPQTFLSWPPHC